MRTIAARLARVLKWAVVVLAVLILVVVVGGVLVFQAIVEPDSAKFGTVPDEAKAAGRPRQTLPAVAKPCGEEPADCSYFAKMDKGLLVRPADGAAYAKEIMEVAALAKLAPEQVRDSASRGQNAWIVWSGGNDRFWDFAASNTGGAFDLLKTVSSYKGMAYGRHNRWSWLGLVNEPCFENPTSPDKSRYGLWLDVRAKDCPADPFEDAARQVVRVRCGLYYGDG